MAFFDIFPTFEEAPYSYIIVPIMLVSSIIGFYYKPYFHALLLHPYEVYRGKRWHTLLTSAFVHRNWLHLLNNILIVYGLGFDMFGTVTAYIKTPILCSIIIVVPNILQTLSKKNDFTFTAVGASGLSFGLYGFSALFFPIEPIENFIFPFVKNMVDNWIIGTIILFLLATVKKNKLINLRLHVVSYLFGSILALIIRTQSMKEIYHIFNNLPQ